MDFENGLWIREWCGINIKLWNLDYLEEPCCSSEICTEVLRVKTQSLHLALKSFRKESTV